uniref:BZIP domain-containing protein n=1 Tax=Aplanochytrium stocchinoi TaxID=215587 RepID=A0A7S3PLK7_9STRA
MLGEDDDMLNWLMAEGLGTPRTGGNSHDNANAYNRGLFRANSLGRISETTPVTSYEATKRNYDVSAASQQESYSQTQQNYDQTYGGGGWTPLADPNFASFNWADALISESPPQADGTGIDGFQEMVQPLNDFGLNPNPDLNFDLDPLVHINAHEPEHRSTKPTVKKETKVIGSPKSAAPMTLTASPSASKTKRPLSPKSQALREKNREAVRNCRKRKREHAEKLKEREHQLMKENEKLRLQLRLGTEELESEVKSTTDVLVERMASLLSKANKSSESEQLLEKTVHMYVSLYRDLGRDREEAMKHITTRLIRRTLPSQVTKMYLWQNAQSEEYFQLKDGLWKEMCARLGLTKDQMNRLVGRRDGVMKLCKQIAGVLYDIRRLHVVVMKKQRRATDMQALNLLSSLLNPVQMAKLLVFAHNDPRCGNVSDQWDRYLKSYDEEIDSEVARGDIRWQFDVPGKKPKKEVNQAQIDEDKVAYLKEARHKSALFMKDLFEAADQITEEKADRVFTPKIEMCDPNFRKPVKGIKKILEHVGRIQAAFNDLKVMEESFTIRDNTNMARGRWSVTGTYHGRGKTKLPEGSPQPGKPVSFRVIIAYKFEHDSERISQLVISWAALDLMRQLGLVAADLGRPKKRVANSYNVPKLSPKRMQELCVEFSKIFELDSVEDRKTMAAKHLDNDSTTTDSNMGGKYSGTDGFVSYSEKLKRVFPEFKLSKHNFVPIKSTSVAGTDDNNALKIQMGCLVSGVYKGALVKEPQPFKFSGEVFFVFDSESEKITEIVMNWNAASLMNQLGVILS